MITSCASAFLCWMFLPSHLATPNHFVASDQKLLFKSKPHPTGTIWSHTGTHTSSCAITIQPALVMTSAAGRPYWKEGEGRRKICPLCELADFVINGCGEWAHSEIMTLTVHIIGATRTRIRPILLTGCICSQNGISVNLSSKIRTCNNRANDEIERFLNKGEAQCNSSVSLRYYVFKHPTYTSVGGHLLLVNILANTWPVSQHVFFPPAHSCKKNTPPSWQLRKLVICYY